MLLALAAVARASGARDGPPTVNVPGVGTLRGRLIGNAGVRLFAGVRYARPPVRDARWRPPQPAPPVSGVVDASTFGPPCPQISNGAAVGDEDCLTLNVYAPPASTSSGSRCPVLVFFHGGSFVTGTANLYVNRSWGPLYNGTALAAQGAVVVTVQYRLGMLGFLAAEALRPRDPTGSTGNYGLLDQRMALRWVQQHIGPFGGDPARVLIFGQSAGAASVELHLLAPGSRGLFAAAALESGAGSRWGYTTWQGGEERLRNVLNATLSGCGDLDCLLAKPASELVKLHAGGPSFECPWAPTVDGVEVVFHPREAIRRGLLYQVPTIVGFTRDECASPSSRFNASATERDFEETALDRVGVPHGELRTALKAVYGAQYSQWYWAGTHFGGDLSIECVSRRFAHEVAGAGAPVYAYKFNRQPGFDVALMYGASAGAAEPRELWGSYHGAELPFVFGNPEITNWRYTMSPEELEVAARIQADWISIAASGAPAVRWPRYSGSAVAGRRWLLLDREDITVEESRLFPQCDLVDEVSVVLRLEPDAGATWGDVVGPAVEEVWV